jgi:hypothetical protein
MQLMTAAAPQDQQADAERLEVAVVQAIAVCDGHLPGYDPRVDRGERVSGKAGLARLSARRDPRAI